MSGAFAETPGRGEWLYLRAAAYSKPDGTDDLDVPKEGGAYLFLFPFDIYTSELTAPISIRAPGNLIRVFPPFLNEEHSGLEVEQIRKRLAPGPAEFPPPGEGAPAFEKISLDHTLGDRTNAVRIDFVPDPEAESAQEFVGRFTGWLRAMSGQWWIGRSRAHSLKPLRNWFGISAAGQRASGFHAFWSYYGGFGTERPVDHHVFARSVSAAAGGHKIQLSWDSLLDAIHHHASGDQRRAILDAAIACEARIGEELQRVAKRDGHAKSSLRTAISSHDFTVQLERGTQRVAGGKSFRKENPASFRLLEQLRTARGNVAHGGPPYIESEDGGGRDATSQEVFAMLHAALTLLNWLGDL